VLYNFCSQPNCTDGGGLFGGLFMDAAGNLYGATLFGGSSNNGVVFQLTPNQGHTGWTKTVLYNFCSQPNCIDGAEPNGGLIIDAAGNLYGTTRSGGSPVAGVVFELTPNQGRTAWTETVLYNFCSQAPPLCTDGSTPYAGLIMDTAGNLYGTTSADGHWGGGVVFELTPNQDHTAWTQTALTSLCNRIALCDHGPQAGVIMDSAGHLFGTASYAGTDGMVFALTNVNQTWIQTALALFCCYDQVPQAGLIMDAAGNLYGTTYGDGLNARGSAFLLTANQFTERTLYSFCSQLSCADGSHSSAGLIMDAAGNLYGTTVAGGNSNNGGVVFELVSYGVAHDFNGDGKSDIVWQNTSGNTAVWLMNGAGVTSIGAFQMSGWSIVGQRDFNGDGKSDLLWRDGSGNMAMWFMNGTAVGSETYVATVPNPWAVQSLNAE
jgi:uncharacterized repeat protein (TIGR03803 family)